MKVSIKKLLVSGLLTVVLTFCAAGAANFDSCAKSLSDIGLLTGTQSGFDLDRASTRGEAAAMLVRLLGKEDEASQLWQESAADFAFTDMEDSAWAKPYVNWLVENGLAAGTTETTFAPRAQCSAQMAATFLLRALGYSDAAGGDFTYFTAMDFAREKGVIDLVNCNEKDFQRDHLVAMCYTALSLQPKTGEADLLSRLVAEGAVADNDASRALRQRFADYRDYVAVSRDFAKHDALTMQMTADVGIEVEGESLRMGMKQDVAMRVDREKMENLEMSMTGSIDITAGGESVSVPNALYFKDGMAYVEAEGEKMKIDMGLEEALQQANIINVQGVSSEPITAISALARGSADGKTIYDVTYNAKLLGNLVDTILGTMMETLPDLSDGAVRVTIDRITLSETVNAQGVLENMKMNMAMKVGDGDVDIGMDMKMDMNITATGDAVRVEFPDLSEFQDMEGLAAVPDPSFFRRPVLLAPEMHLASGNCPC